MSTSTTMADAISEFFDEITSKTMADTRSKSKTDVPTSKKERKRMVVPESGVMTRSRSKASTAVAKTVAKKKKKTRPIVHAWNWKTDITKTRKVICGKKKPPKAFYKSKLFINNVKSDALDIFLEENEALNEFVRIHKDDDPKTTAPTKRRLIMDRYKDWCTMTLLEQAPYLKRAAKNYLEEDKTMEKMLRKVR